MLGLLALTTAVITLLIISIAILNKRLQALEQKVAALPKDYNRWRDGAGDDAESGDPHGE